MRIRGRLGTATARTIGRLRTLIRDRRAVSAVEFALLLPLMLALYIAGNETSLALTIYRKVSHTGSALGDLTSQVSSLSNSDMANIMAATTAVMAPYSDNGLQIVVSAVEMKNNAYLTDWSRAQNTTAWTENTVPPITIPIGLITNGQQIVVTQVKYTYVSAFSTFMKDIWGTNSITLSDVSYFRPRVSSTISAPGS